MAKRVPADPLLDPDSLRSRSDNSAENCLSPIWMASAMMLIGEYPIIGFTVSAAISPLSKFLGDLGNHLKAAMSYHLKSGHRETA